MKGKDSRDTYKDDQVRIMISLGLMAAFLAGYIILKDFAKKSEGFLSYFIEGCLLYWGFSTITLFLYIITRGLEYKYRSKGRVESGSMDLKIPETFQEFLYDLGIENYTYGLIASVAYTLIFFFQSLLTKVIKLPKLLIFYISLIPALIIFALVLVLILRFFKKWEGLRKKT